MGNLVNRVSRNRRFARRYNVKTALRVRSWNSPLPEQRAESVNISQRGILFATNSLFQKGETLDILLKMPEEITGDPPTEWLCTGHIMRVEPSHSPKGKFGVAVRFDCYEVARSEPPRPFLQASAPAC